MEIEAYSFGSMKINGREFTADLLIYQNEIMDSWWREEGHSLSLKDLSWLLDKEPRLIIIGRGKNGIMSVPEKTEQELTERGIEFKAAKTDEAVRMYNQAVKAGKNVGAGFHLTC